QTRRNFACLLCFTSRRRHTRLVSDWSSDVCSSDLSHWRHSRATNQRRLLKRLAGKERRSVDWLLWNVANEIAAEALKANAGTIEIGRASCREREDMEVDVAGLRNNRAR